MIHQVDSCTGCGCCQAVCPQKCIEMQFNKKGERFPKVDQEKCVDCGLCEARCPVLKEDNNSNRTFPKVYMCQHEDQKVLSRSASGGAFSVLADYVFEHDGVVFGAVWRDDFSVGFYEARNHSEIEKMHGSKYVQSFLEQSVYRKIKTQLNDGIMVLFCGLPCQCAAVQSFLGKEYENFINVDIVCHGTAPDILLKKHIAEMNKKGSTIKAINHTSKKNNWSILIQRTIDYTKEDGTHVFLDRTEDFYLNNFLNHLFFNKACYSCHFASMPRETDFTIGDFFGIGSLEKVDSLDDRGVSMMMTNSLKSQKILNGLFNFGKFEERSLEEALYFNHNLWKPSQKNSHTDEFWNDYFEKDWSQLYEKYGMDAHNTQVINIWIRNTVKKILGPKHVCQLMYVFYKYKGYIHQVDDIIEEMKDGLLDD